MRKTQKTKLSEESEYKTVKTTIVNVVATAHLDQMIDLYELEKFREIRHDTEIYGGRVAYFKDPFLKGKVSIFTSGKMISIGTKNEKEAIRELNLTKDFLVKNKVIEQVQLQPKIQNVVAMAEMEERINLEELSKNNKIIYEPEQFPGGILRITEPYKTTILVFASGKTIITGLKSSNQVEPVVQKLLSIIKANETK